MISRNSLRHWYTVFILTVLLALAGCLSFKPSKPNVPYRGELTIAFKNLERSNPLLAKEIRKLPEVMDGISDLEKEAVNELIVFYNSNRSDFENTFGKMYRVGKPDIRKYNSPLQALLWIALDDDLFMNKDIVTDYSLKKLLDKAWVFENVVFKTDAQILEIINGIQDEDEKTGYLNDMKNTDRARMQTYILTDYKRTRDLFSKEAKRKIRRAINLSEKNSRWGNLSDVVDRLNSPELLDYYERHVFSYSHKPGYGEGPDEIERVFRNKSGHCAQITAFSVYVLRKSGYEAKRYIVANPALRSPGGNLHRATLYYNNGRKYILDNGRGTPQGIVRFEDYDDTVTPEEAEALQSEPMIYSR